MKRVTIFTDGSCLGNPGPGGWCAILKHGRRERVLQGGHKDTTNQRMELTAAIEGLMAVRFECVVTLYTDSQYVEGIISKDWKAKENMDLIAKLYDIKFNHDLRIIWIRGHSYVTENERCDRIAKREAEKFKRMNWQKKEVNA